MGAFFDRIDHWMSFEPTTALTMLIAAIVLFGATFIRRRGPAGDRFWPWIRAVIEATVTALLFVGLLWAFRSILNANRSVFHSTHGSVSDANLNSAYSIWGRPHTQLDLSVWHNIYVTKQVEIPREDPNEPPLYREEEVREVVDAHTIERFRGEVFLTLSEREKGYAYYNGFETEARFEYDVINYLDEETEVDFNFPLSPGQTIHEGFQITADGEDIGPQLNFGYDAVTWTDTMQPHETRTIVVTYTSRGMEYFYYQIQNQREIRDFTLTLTVDRLPVSLLNYPEGCLTPMKITPTDDGMGSVLTWRFDRAITTAGMGVALPTPEQPGAKVLRGLQESPYALSLLIATISLTLLILGRPVRFLELALLSGAYCVEFLLMAAISDTFLGFWGSLLLGAALTSVLAFLLYRKDESKLLRILVSSLVLFFTIAYPLAGLLPQDTQRNTFDGLVQVGLIVYLFGLSLYAQLQTRKASAQGLETATL